MSEGPKINKRILVAPLDWGLGHATRCIPIIRLLRHYGAEVWIATSGPQEVLLRAEFPDAPFLNLSGYKVHYGKHGVMLQLLRQIPVIRRHIFTEHAWLQQVIGQYGFSGVISDNRYGLYSEQIPSVLITHQLALQLPRWASFVRSGVQQILFQHIEHFGECWVPDLPDEASSLAGDMSHPGVQPNLPVHAIGWLSRFTPSSTPPERDEAILISLSGPEPQRTLLEDKILAQIEHIQQPVWLVRGLPGATDVPKVPPHVTVYNHLPTGEMEQLMQRCKLLISRSGYSTLMDAMVLGSPIASVPTPGQTEQEYLSKRLDAKGWSVSQSQDNFNLPEIIEKSMANKRTPQASSQGDLLKNVMGNWLKKLE